MKRTFYALVLVSALSVAFLAKTNPVVAPVASDLDQSRPLIPSGSEVVGGEKIERINSYLAKHWMPLAGYGQQFTEVAEKYGLDWRLLPAIAVRESSGGKQMCGHNPFGWASCRADFKSVREAIDYIAINLAGENPHTASYYKNKTTREKLRAYNGTVNPKYPDEVLAIMEKF